MRVLKNLAAFLKIAALALLLGARPAGAGENELPSIGESGAAALSVTEEQQIGDQLMRSLYRFDILLDDPLASDYLEHLGFRLVAANPDARGRKFHFFVLEDPGFNAMAFPGGYIGVNTGLVAEAESESELASVLAHEVAHVTQRHLARRLERAQQLTLPYLIGALGSILLAGIDPQLAIAGLTASQAGATQNMINHTRANEQEADRIGIATLADSGLDPGAMAVFFGKMQTAARYYRKPPEFLSTHPLTQNRIAEARLRAAELPPARIRQDPEFDLFKVRVVHLGEQNHDALLQTWQDKADKGQLRTDADHYAWALALTRDRRFDLARRELQALLQKDPDNPFFVIALAELDLAANTPAQALPQVRAARLANPSSYPLVMTEAKLLLARDQPEMARRLLLREQTDRMTPPQLKLLAEAESRAGLGAEMHETQGLYLYGIGDLDGARLQYQLALRKRSDDPYAQTRIQARIDQVREVMEMMKEERRR